MANTIHIAYALDDKYTEHTCVSMTSILYNTKSDISFHIIYKKLSKKNKNKLMLTHNKISFYEFNIENPEDYILNMHWTIETYYRLHLTEILYNLKKVIWIDGDTIAENDVSEIWNFNLNGKYAAAVPYMVEPNTDKQKCLKVNCYFNAGVILFDLQLLRESNLLYQPYTKIPEIYNKLTNQGLKWSSDQDVLNYLLNGNVAILPFRANIMPNIYMHLNNDFICLEEAANAITKPLIIHFGGLNHPSFLEGEQKRYDSKIIERYYFYKSISSFANIKEDTILVEKYKILERSNFNEYIYDEYEYIFRNMNSIFRDFIDKISLFLSGKKLIFYGTDNTIRTIMAEFAAKGIYADLLVDGSGEKYGNSIYNLVVQNPEILNNKRDEYFILLSMLDKKEAEKAARQLIKYGYNENEFHYLFSPLWEQIEKKSKPKLLLITSAPTSGKGAFTSLLDDHDNIFTIPAWHDKLVNSHLYADIITGTSHSGKYAHIIKYYNTILANSDWQTLGIQAFQKKLIFPLNSSKNIQVPFNIDFNKINQNILLDLSKIQKYFFTGSRSLYVIIKNLIKYITPEKKIKYFVSQGINGFYDFELFFNKYPDSKAIFIKREIIDWLFSWINRMSESNNNEFRKNVFTLTQQHDKKNSFIDNSLKAASVAEDIQRKYPERLKIVKFEEVILNTKRTMDDVAEFLNIEKSDKLYNSSVLGIKIESVGSIEDNSQKMATPEQIELLKKLIKTYCPNDNMVIRKTKVKKILKCLLPYGFIRLIQKNRSKV